MPGVFWCIFTLIGLHFFNDKLFVVKLRDRDGRLSAKHFAIQQGFYIRQHNRKFIIAFPYYILITRKTVNQGLPYLNAGISLLYFHEVQSLREGFAHPLAIEIAYCSRRRPGHWECGASVLIILHAF